jgi:hypothetical protein
MFERITLDRPGGPANPIDLGVLAECLVFYETVRVIVDQVTFRFLVRSCGAEQLLDLMTMGALEIEFIENLTGVVSRPVGNQTIYDYGNIATRSLNFQVVARKLFDELAGPSGKRANKRYDRFDKLVKRFNYTSAIAAEARADWSDTNYLRQAAGAYLAIKSPNYVPPANLEFRAQPTPQGITIVTNIDFAAADADYRAVNNTSEPHVSPSHILSSISDTRRDLTVGSSFGSEFAMGPVPSAIAACKFSNLINKATSGRERVSVFQEDVLDDLPNIREAVNSGSRNFSDVVRLVEQAKKFKEWLRKQDEDEQIRKSYLRDVMHVDWADKLPPKALRWLIFTGGGLLLGAAFTNPITGTAAGTALSVADSFLLDKLIKGWKPNQFIDGPLKEFLQHTTRMITL